MDKEIFTKLKVADIKALFETEQALESALISDRKSTRLNSSHL